MVCSHLKIRPPRPRLDRSFEKSIMNMCFLLCHVSTCFGGYLGMFWSRSQTWSDLSDSFPCEAVPLKTPNVCWSNNKKTSKLFYCNLFAFQKSNEGDGPVCFLKLGWGPPHIFHTQMFTSLAFRVNSEGLGILFLVDVPCVHRWVFFYTKEVPFVFDSLGH